MSVHYKTWFENEKYEKEKVETEIKSLQDNERERFNNDIKKRLSKGENYFLEAYFDKRIGARELSLNRRIGEAKSGFEKSLKEMPDDPEARIYSENVWVMQKTGAEPENKKQIRTVAVSVPIQKNASIAKEILRGVAQAQWEINKEWRTKCDDPLKRAKNCASRLLLQVLIASDDNNSEIAKGIASYIVKSRKDVLAVIGHNSSEVSNAVIKEYQGKLVMLSPTSYTLNHSASEILDAKDSNYIYSMPPSLERTLPVIIDYIKSLGIPRNVYFCADPKAHDTTRFIAGLKNEITLIGYKEENGGKYTIECDISEPQEEIDFLKVAIEKHQLTDLFLSIHVSTIIDAFILARRADNKLNLYNAHTLFNIDVLRKEFNGLVTVVSWHSEFPYDDKSRIKSKEFIKDAKCIWNGYNEQTGCTAGKFDPDINITWRSAMAYDATQLIIEGLNQISPDVTGDEARKELQKQISKLETNGVTGKIVFGTNGERKGGQGHLVKVVEITKEKGETKVDCEYAFVPLGKQQNGRYELPLKPSKEGYRFLKKDEECKKVS